MTRKALLVGSILILGLAACAQEFPRAEVAVTYSYARFSPATHYTPNMNLNGGGGSFTYNLNSWFGIKADLHGFGASKATFTIPPGSSILPSGTGATFKTSGNLFTYLFGPQIKIRAEKVHPYVHALFGAAHTSVFADAAVACPDCILNPLSSTTSTGTTVSRAPSGNAFAMELGGGIDIPVHKNVAIRVGEVDYLMTRFNNSLETGNYQHNFRYSAGVLFSFGGE